eukprot:10009185-Lingulodinium_polyedra.AAC.1
MEAVEADCPDQDIRPHAGIGQGQPHVIPSSVGGVPQRKDAEPGLGDCPIDPGEAAGALVQVEGQDWSSSRRLRQHSGLPLLGWLGT